MEDVNKKKRNVVSADRFSISGEKLAYYNLSYRNFSGVQDCIKLSTQLCELNLSHNNLRYVPQSVMDMCNIRILDLSFNNIEVFDDPPRFYNVIETLDISNNNLKFPPRWVWKESPERLIKVNMRMNVGMCNNLESEYFLQLLHHETRIGEIYFDNCCLNKHKKLIGTFPNAVLIQLGHTNLSLPSANSLHCVPFEGLDRCIEVEKLYLQNTFVSVISSEIKFFQNLVEIDLSNNKLSGLPPEFCLLRNLQVCLLSCNKILYLPDQIVNMENLKVLSLDSNDLCMLPDNLVKLHNLKKIDLYDNFLSDIPGIEQFDEIDLAQNHHDEPDSVTYLTKRNKLRLTTVERCCGRKAEVIQDDYEFTSDEESLFNEELEDRDLECGHRERSDSSSSEDWDSDDWWIPTSEPSRVVFRSEVKRLAEPWLIFTHEKIAAGNFCPCDLHVLPISDRINHKQTGNSQVPQRSDDLDQFDDDYDDDNY